MHKFNFCFKKLYFSTKYVFYVCIYKYFIIKYFVYLYISIIVIIGIYIS